MAKQFILGSAQFGNKYGINNPNASKSKKKSLDIIKYAKSSGINTIDLADKYNSYKNIFTNFKFLNFDNCFVPCQSISKITSLFFINLSTVSLSVP